MIKKIIGIILIIIASIIGYQKFFQKKGTIIYITTPENAGDRNQMLGVINQIKLQQRDKWIDQEISYKDFEKNKEKIIKSLKTRNIILSSGIYGINALAQLENKDNYTSFVKVHLSHQLLKDYDKLIKTNGNPHGSNIIVLPEHEELSENLKNNLNNSKTQLIRTEGVCHNRTKEETKNDYQKHKSYFYENKKFLVIMLGGDVQKTDGSWMQYKKNSVEKIVPIVIERARKFGLTIVILNGGRTGMHQESGEIDEDVHKGKVDHITQHFIDLCEQNNFKDIILLDKQPDLPNLTSAALGAVLSAEGSELWLPGETTSMISEVIDIIGNKRPIIAYEHEAMAETHYKYIESEFEKGHIKKVSEKGKIIEPPVSFQKKEKASQQVAQGILKLILNKD